MAITVVISDTSVLVDLERGHIVEVAFKTKYQLAVPDVLYERELKPHGGERLLELGLQRLQLDDAGMTLAATYRAKDRRISVVDSLALAIAKQQALLLLTGDGALRALGCTDGVDCHGVLWLLDVMENDAVPGRPDLQKALKRIAEHARCRLPKDGIAERLARYSG